MKTPGTRTEKISRLMQRVASKFTLAQGHLQGEKKFMVSHCVKSHIHSPFVQVALSCDTAK